MRNLLKTLVVMAFLVPAILAHAHFYDGAWLNGALAKDETYANWYDEEFDNLITQIRGTVDVDARAKLYGEMQKGMREDPPFIYLYYPEAFEGVTLRVQNYRPRGAENYYLGDVSVLD